MRCSLIIIASFLMITEINAYECQIALTQTNVTVISDGLCTYLNYHICMLTIFGPSAVFFMMKAAFHAGCKDDPDAAEFSGKCAFVCAGMTLGVEFSLIFLYISVLLLLITRYIALFTKWIFSAIALFTKWILRKATHRVVPVVVIVVESPITVAPAEPMNITIVIMDPTTDSCPICLSSDNGDWAVTGCGHKFHNVCIKKWTNRTCPMCRMAF